MILLAELQKQIGRMGQLRYAWFTSFNLDIEFVETFILPTTLGVERPRNGHEFEQLQQEITEKNIDFRVFCDPRFLETNRIKRTCIPIHGIRPDRSAMRFSQDSLFHPKVIYLEDFDGMRIVGTGSANLTLSGWGRNLEAFCFRDVTTSENYREIRRFFESLCRDADVDPCPLSSRMWSRTAKADWRFVHSYQKASFIEQMLYGTKDADMVVWSPYLPRDLGGFIERLQTTTSTQDLRIHLVPDLINGTKLRTDWSERLSRMITAGKLTFHRRPVEGDPRSDMCHAKLWKLAGKLAIGSWNFTGPGSNSLRDAKDNWSLDNNVEAGIIFDNNNDWQNACAGVLELGANDCASAEELKKEGLPEVHLPPFDLHISFDWQTHAYSFKGQWLAESARDGYFVSVPGVKSCIPLKWNRSGEPIQPTEMVIDDSAVVRDRVFKIYFNDHEIHRALISEHNAKARRSQSFELLHDLLEALVHGDDPRTMTGLTIRGPVDMDTFADESPTILPDMPLLPECGTPERSTISYFRLFKAMRDYGEALARFETLERLEQRVFVVPGCLVELVEKTGIEMQSTGREVFNWFLANEVATVCRIAHKRRRELMRITKNVSATPKSRWDGLIIESPKSPNGVSADYSALVRKQSGYD